MISAELIRLVDVGVALSCVCSPRLTKSKFNGLVKREILARGETRDGNAGTASCNDIY
jgi:hypothetical protein